MLVLCWLFFPFNPIGLLYPCYTLAATLEHIRKDGADEYIYYTHDRVAGHF